MEKTVEQKPILTQSQMEDMLLIMGQRIQAIEAKIDILLARTEPKQIDPNQIDNLHQMD